MSLLLALGLGGLAEAADLAVFAGDWAIDPTMSDDPAEVVEGVVVGSSMGSQASQYSPDNGESAGEDDTTREHLVADVYSLVGQTGRITLRPADDGLVDVTLSGAQPVRMGDKSGWAKVKEPDGDNLRMRLTESGDRLVLERRLRSTRIVETLIPPDRDGLLVAVVRVDGAIVSEGIEFRRVYRSLDAAAPAAP